MKIMFVNINIEPIKNILINIFCFIVILFFLYIIEKVYPFLVQFFKKNKYAFIVKNFLITFLIYMCFCNRENIITIFKYRDSSSWFSAIATIAAVFVALIPQFEKNRIKTSNLHFNASIENVGYNFFSVKFEIENGLDRTEEVIPSSQLYYYYLDKNKTYILTNTTNDVYNFTFKNQKIFVFGKQKRVDYSELLQIDFNKVQWLSSRTPSLVKCVSAISILENNIDTYFDFSIYEIKNNSFNKVYNYTTKVYKDGAEIIKAKYGI